MPTRITRSRAKGWKAPDGAVYVGRGSKWGNPFVVGKHGNAKRCVELYGLAMNGFIPLSNGDDVVDAAIALRDRVAVGELKELVGKDLMCWCRNGDACHADLLLACADEMEQKRK